MKKIAFILTMMLFVTINLSAQTIQGVVFDKKTQMPIPFVNVMFLRSSDSTFVAGCTTDSVGRFSFATVEANAMLKVSHIGYQTEYIKPVENIVITLQEDESVLNEVVVKGSIPTYKMVNGIFISKIEGTVYSELGVAKDVLKQLPFIYESKDEISVLGKGSPLFYINGRKMRNKEELEDIKSDMLKEVRIEMNPGAKYPSGTKAVIHIVTNRPPSDGLAGAVTVNGSQADFLSHYESANLNYRYGKLDFFFNGRYNFSKKKDEKGENYTFPYQGETIFQGWNGYENSRNKDFRLTGGVNYTFSQNHSLGIQYIHKRDIESENSLPFENFIKNDVQNNVFHSDLHMSGHGFSNTLFLYYMNKFCDKWELTIDATCQSNKSSFSSIETEDWHPQNIINIANDGKSHIYAVKATISNEVAFGKINWGVEGIYTKSRNHYVMRNDSLSAIIPSNRNEAKQKYLSAFLSYQSMLGPIGVEAGVRYEHTKYVYFKNEIKQTDECRTYTSFLPNISLSSQLGEFALSLNYNVDIERPGYKNLFDGILYVNSFVYVQGNPMLKNAYDHNFSFIAAYGDWQLMLNYDYIKDYLLTTNSLFQQCPVVIQGYQNHDKRQFNTYIVYSPKISFWRPTFTMGFDSQHLNYNEREYSNKPMMTVEWKNILTLPNKSWFVCNFNWHSSGRQDLMQVRSSWSLNSYIIKNWKNWRFQLGANDIFGTNKSQITFYDGDIVRKHYADSYDQSVYLNIRYNIKTYKSRYKGKTAGQSEIDRL